MTVKKIIYHCYGGAHSSVTAAAIHLGQLQADKIPTAQELLSLALFDRQTAEGHGQLHFFGFDEWGNQIYSVGCRNVGQTMVNILHGVSKLLGIHEQLVFVDTLHCVSLKMRIGGYLSRRWSIISVGRPLVIQGTREAYPKIVELVAQVKVKLAG
ncbi:MAG TPA: DUF3189 family protein [Oscillospiraceae bacterium]|nr:DUF3189 family protein [Oscillospiraceae bacterium]